jgi:hypothetical protein
LIVRSGSYTGTSAVLSTDYENGSFGYSPLYATGSLVDNTILREYSVGTNGWNQALLTSSDATNGKVLSFTIDSAGSYFKIYNKKTKQYTTAGNTITYSDTYFPLQNNDFIRFGLVGGNVTASLDYSFTAGGLVRLLSSSYGGNPNAVSTLITSPEIPAVPRADILGNNQNQNFRIFRRIPDETSVLVSTNPQINVTSGEVGILIPQNFNINYDPITIAKAAGLIS